jgi:hypothetical protein
LIWRLPPFAACSASAKPAIVTEIAGLRLEETGVGEVERAQLRQARTLECWQRHCKRGSGCFVPANDRQRAREPDGRVGETLIVDKRSVQLARALESRDGAGRRRLFQQKAEPQPQARLLVERRGRGQQRCCGFEALGSLGV